MKRLRLAAGSTLALLALTVFGACGTGDNGTACGANGLKNGTCQAGPTCPSGSAVVSITDPFDSCSAGNTAGGIGEICCVPTPDTGTFPVPDASTTTTPDTGVSHPGDATVVTDARRGADGATDATTTPDTGHDSGVDAPKGNDATQTVDSGGGMDAPTPIDGGHEASVDASHADGGHDAGKACDGGSVCTKTSDCPVPATACVTATCSDGCCGTTNAAASTVCSDNGGKLCDGSGTCVACLTTTDCPTPATTCQIESCNTTTHTCSSANATLGTACGTNGDVCNAGACVTSHCADGVMDSDETDVDCGGSCGATCTFSPQEKCKVGADCTSHVCSGAPLLCQAPTCSDGVQNGNETDVDCGGAGFDGQAACAPCGDKKHCGVNADCTNGDCFGAAPGTCVSCMDGVKDGNETAVDCGGTQCDAQGKTCALTAACQTGSDCASGICTANVCALAAVGATCTAGTTCATGDCVNGFCCDTACAGQCQACSAALTGLANGTCGNVSDGTTCNDGNGCTQTDTCELGICTGGNLKTCSAEDQCHTAGTCDSATGNCSNPTVANGTACTLTPTACYTASECTNGTCSGTFCSSNLCGASLSAFTGTDTTGWSLNGAATYDVATHTVVLVDGTGAEAGTAIYQDAITADAFTVSFDFLFTTTNGRADGIAFVLETDGPTAVGGGYGGFGVLGLHGYATELDIFDSGPCDGGNGNHAGVDLLSACGSNGGVPSPLATSGDLYDGTMANNGVGDIGDGTWRTETVQLSGGALSVSVTGTTGTVIPVGNLQNVALTGFVPGTPYYFGLAAGSGSNNQNARAEIRNVSITFPASRCL